MTSEIKPIYGIDRVKLADVIPLSTPFSVFVFPSTHCNFKCIYCGYSLGYPKMKEKYDFVPENMSMETYTKILEQLKEFPNKLKMLSLTGQGEPLLNKNVPLMVKLAKEANIAERIEIITNASLLTPEMSDGLIEAGLDTLRISMQGLSSEKYKEICGSNIDFEKFMENIKYFYRHKSNTNFFVKIMDVSLEGSEEEKFYQLFHDCSDRMYIEKMLPAYEGVEITLNMKVDYDRYGRKHQKRAVCPLPFYMLGIFPNGDVEPCDTIYKPIVLGNVNHERLIRLWNGKELKKFWKMQLKKERCTNTGCASCCAPNDVAHPEDILDDDVDDLFDRIDG
ncbi:radical SAM/SPASM domain-containing protein [Desulfosporosinus shakirovi]|uniref:radical SAM/SPASM domain-containing protein n=1 Tax=Desulfosporosinus shakirovi TaxID=2885154 RepID=UPI00249F04A9|nr:radical SAM protein [Desulfosporosinus sp. SRJS8]MCB8814156.1 radical SAM protein [Desulfosporosinus sp. SRJS8]